MNTENDPGLDQVPFIKGEQIIYQLGKRRSVWQTISDWWNRK